MRKSYDPSVRRDAPTRKPDRATVLKLAAVAVCDPRSAERALMHGPFSVRGMVGERIAIAMRKLGIEDPRSGKKSGKESGDA